MTDETPTTRPRKRQDEVIEDAVVIDNATAASVDADATPVAEPVEAPTSPAEPLVEPAVGAHAAVAEPEAPASPVEAPGSPAHAGASPAEPVEATASTPRVVYIEAPAQPKKQGNRAVGVLLALLATVIFTIVLALATLVVQAARTGFINTSFLAELTFYIPIAVFLVAFVVLVLIANRAAWWAYILGSLIVGLAVYFGTIGIGMLSAGLFQMTPSEAAAMWNASLGNAFIIAAGILAREVSMWMGVAIARRGRRVRERNVQRRSDWEREVAEKRAEGERVAYSAAASQ